MKPSESPVKIPANMRPRTPEQKRRRQVREWFVQCGALLRDAIYETAPGLDFGDYERLNKQLAGMLASFAGGSRVEFRGWSTEQTTRLALLSSHIKAMADAPVDIKAALEHLPEFTGRVDDVDGLREWAVDLTVREGARILRNEQAFQEWYRLHQGAVRAGIMDFLSGCLDLCPGQSGPFSITDTVDEIAAMCWLRIHENMDKYLKPGDAQIQTRLRRKAQKEARRWKTERLRKLEKEPEVRVIGVKSNYILDLLNLPDDGRPKPKPIVLGPNDEEAYRSPVLLINRNPEDVERTRNRYALKAV